KAQRDSLPTLRPSRQIFAAGHRATMYSELWNCVACQGRTAQPKILRGRAGGWRVSTICRRCQRQNLHSKHMNWLAAQKAWKAIALNVSAAWMQQHSKKLSDWYWDLEQDPHWKIKKPQFAAGASGKGATTDGDDTRPVTFALSPDEPDLQTNPN